VNSSAKNWNSFHEYICNYTHTHKHTHTLCLSLSLAHTQTHTHTHTHTHAHTHTHTHIHTHKHTHSEKQGYEQQRTDLELSQTQVVEKEYQLLKFRTQKKTAFDADRENLITQNKSLTALPPPPSLSPPSSFLFSPPQTFESVSVFVRTDRYKYR